MAEKLWCATLDATDADATGMSEDAKLALILVPLVLIAALAALWLL